MSRSTVYLATTKPSLLQLALYLASAEYAEVPISSPPGLPTETHFSGDARGRTTGHFLGSACVTLCLVHPFAERLCRPNRPFPKLVKMLASIRHIPILSQIMASRKLATIQSAAADSERLSFTSRGHQVLIQDMTVAF